MSNLRKSSINMWIDGVDTEDKDFNGETLGSIMKKDMTIEQKIDELESKAQGIRPNYGFTEALREAILYGQQTKAEEVREKLTEMIDPDNYKVIDSVIKYIYEKD